MASSLNDYDPDLSGDIVQATKAARKLQTSFDQSNASQYLTPQQQGQPAAPVAAPAGPVARAAQQLPAAPASSLYDIKPAGSTGLNGQTSFDQSNTPSRYLPQATRSAPPAPAQPLNSSSAQASVASSGSSLDNFRGTGIGVGAQGGQIAVSQGPDGVPSFSNLPAAQQQAASLGNIQPRAAIGPSASDDPSASLASIGSLSNLGNGRGTFSQAQAGDAALATGRFGRASQLRQGYTDQDRLTAGLNANDRANSLTIVRDSSKPFTRSELIQAQLDQQAQQGRLAAISAATANLNGGIDRQGAQQQLRQASRLEDLQVAATGPNATPQAQAAYQQAIDPTGEKALGRQLTLANTSEKNASAAKLNNEASGANGPKLTEQQAKDLQYFDRGNAANGELATQGDALTTAAIGDRGAARGRLDAALRSLPGGNSAVVNSLISPERQKAEQSGREFINAILRKDSGAALTDTEIAEYGRTYLPQAGDSDGVLKQKEQACSRAIEGIKKGLGPGQILATATIKPDQARQAASSQSAPSNQHASSAIPRANTAAEAAALPVGSVFIGPDGRQYRK